MRDLAESTEITYELVRKEIKHLYIRIDREDGSVRVSAPRRMNDDVVRAAVRSRQDWILKRRAAVRARRADVRLEYATGETVQVFGVPHQLNVVETRSPIRVERGEGQVLDLHIRPESNRTDRLTTLDRWYRAEMNGAVPSIVNAWEPRIDVRVNEWRVRRMRTRWGSCNIGARRICLNLELARHPIRCLEYVVVHEMTHLLERGHNRRFYALMDQFLPDWRVTRAILNGVSIG